MSKSSRPMSAHRVPPYRRPIIVGGFLLILAIVVIVTVFIFKGINTSHDDNTSQNSKPTDSNVDNSDMSDDAPKEPPLENKAPQYEGESPNELDSLTGSIAYIDIDTETQTLHSAVSINQYLENDGQCVFNLKRGEAIIRTASAIATPDVTTSVCGPFSLSVEGLDSGVYQVEIIMTGDNKRGTITSETEI